MINAEEMLLVSKHNLDELMDVYKRYKDSPDTDNRVIAIGIDTALRWLHLPPYTEENWYE